MFDAIEAEFAAAARTPKGQRALRGIFRAMRATVSRHGVDAASLDAIAEGAGLTQPALRHYFPTRDELVSAFFRSGAEWYRRRLEDLLQDRGRSPREQLAECIRWHLEFMEDVDAILWFESTAYWLRNPEGRKVRDAWYGWLTGRYAVLIGAARPDLPPREQRRRAFALWTLVLGGWVTHARGSALRQGLPATERHAALLDTALQIAFRQ